MNTCAWRDWSAVVAAATAAVGQRQRVDYLGHSRPHAAYSYLWRELWHDQMPVDHFSFVDGRSFKLRYLLNDSYWTDGGPIFFYCGNEGAIELFTNNTVVQSLCLCCNGGRRCPGSDVGLGAAVQRAARLRRASLLWQDDAVRRPVVQVA